MNKAKKNGSSARSPDGRIAHLAVPVRCCRRSLAICNGGFAPDWDPPTLGGEGMMDRVSDFRALGFARGVTLAPTGMEV